MLCSCNIMTLEPVWQTSTCDKYYIALNNSRYDLITAIAPGQISNLTGSGWSYSTNILFLHYVRGQPGQNSQLHARLPPIFLDMDAWMTTQMKVAFASYVGA